MDYTNAYIEYLDLTISNGLYLIEQKTTYKTALTNPEHTPEFKSYLEKRILQLEHSIKNNNEVLDII